MRGNTFDLREALQELHRRYGTWRRVAEILGHYSAARWCAIAKGTQRPSRRAENLVRRYYLVAPRGIERLFDMSAGDLRWYLKNRAEVRGGGCADGTVRGDVPSPPG
ncbi:MAG TPA: hypothetical protein G4O02_06750 [Caldilineae bacterium]|jgi:hypothetical protein|nr:hypothetical protein [Caldilineae bacterium]